jgi:hypothetical protein
LKREGAANLVTFGAPPEKSETTAMLVLACFSLMMAWGQTTPEAIKDATPAMVTGDLVILVEPVRVSRILDKTTLAVRPWENAAEHFRKQVILEGVLTDAHAEDDYVGLCGQVFRVAEARMLDLEKVPVLRLDKAATDGWFDRLTKDQKIREDAHQRQLKKMQGQIPFVLAFPEEKPKDPKASATTAKTKGKVPVAPKVNAFATKESVFIVAAIDDNPTQSLNFYIKGVSPKGFAVGKPPLTLQGVPLLITERRVIRGVEVYFADARQAQAHQKRQAETNKSPAQMAMDAELAKKERAAETRKLIHDLVEQMQKSVANYQKAIQANDAPAASHSAKAIQGHIEKLTKAMDRVCEDLPKDESDKLILQAEAAIRLGKESTRPE